MKLDIFDLKYKSREYEKTIEVPDNISIAKLLPLIGLARSISEAKQVIKQGGIRVYATT